MLWIFISFQLFHASDQSPLQQGTQYDTIHVFGEVNLNSVRQFDVQHIRGFQNGILKATSNLKITSLKSLANIEIDMNNNTLELPTGVLMYNVTFSNQVFDAFSFQQFVLEHKAYNITFKGLNISNNSQTTVPEYLFPLDTTMEQVYIINSTITAQQIFKSVSFMKGLSNIYIYNSTLRLNNLTNTYIDSNFTIANTSIICLIQRNTTIPFQDNNAHLSSNVSIINVTFSNFNSVLDNISLNSSIFQNIDIQMNYQNQFINLINTAQEITYCHMQNINLISYYNQDYSIIRNISNIQNTIINEIQLEESKQINFSVINMLQLKPQQIVTNITILDVKITVNAELQGNPYINIINTTTSEAQATIANSTFDINITSQPLNNQIVSNVYTYINGFGYSVYNISFVNVSLTSQLQLYGVHQAFNATGFANIVNYTTMNNTRQNIQLTMWGDNLFLIYANSISNISAINATANIYPQYYRNNTPRYANVEKEENISSTYNDFISTIYGSNAQLNNKTFGKLQLNTNPIKINQMRQNNVFQSQSQVQATSLDNYASLHLLRKLLSKISYQLDQIHNIQPLKEENIMITDLPVAELNSIVQQQTVNIQNDSLIICPPCFEILGTSIICQMSSYCEQNQSTGYLLLKDETRTPLQSCQSATQSNVQWCSTTGPVCKSGFSGAACTTLLQTPIVKQPFFWLFLILLIIIIILIIVICLLKGCCGCCACACSEQNNKEKLVISKSNRYISNATPFLSEQKIKSPLDQDFYTETRLKLRPHTDLGRLQERSIKVNSSIGWQQQRIQEMKEEQSRQQFDPLKRFGRKSASLKPLSELQQSNRNYLQDNQTQRHEEQKQMVITKYLDQSTTKQTAVDDGRSSKLTNRSSIHTSTVSTDQLQNIVQNIQNIIAAPPAKPRQITYQLENFSDSEPDSTFHPEQDSKWRLTEQQMTIRGDEVKRIYNGEELFSDSNLIEIMNRRRHQYADSQVSIPGSNVIQQSHKNILDQ